MCRGGLKHVDPGGSLLSFIVRRLLITIPLLLLISFAVFSLVLILPGNPALTLAGGIHSTPAEVARITRQLHLNEPFYRQYLRWLGGVVHGNLGISLFNPGQSVASGIGARFPVTLTLAVGGMISCRCSSAYRPGSSPACTTAVLGTGRSRWAPAWGWPYRTTGWPSYWLSGSPSTPTSLARPGLRRSGPPPRGSGSST